MEVFERKPGIYTYHELLEMMCENNVPCAEVRMKKLMKSVDNDGLWFWIAMQEVVDSCFRYIEEAKKNDKKGSH